MQPTGNSFKFLVASTAVIVVQFLLHDDGAAMGNTLPLLRKRTRKTHPQPQTFHMGCSLRQGEASARAARSLARVGYLGGSPIPTNGTSPPTFPLTSSQAIG